MSRLRRARLVAPIAVVLLGLAASNAGLVPSGAGPRIAPLVPVGAGAGTNGGGGPAVKSGQTGMVVSDAVHHDRSPSLRSITPRPPAQGEQDPDQNDPHPLPGRAGAASLTPTGVRDPALQTGPVAAAPPTLLTNIEGVSNLNGVLPPDPNGDVGPNNYVQWVNLSFAIYDKSGTKLYGPAAGSTLWTGFGGACETSNDGDPIAQYDSFADRWMLSQFALPNYPSGPFYQCIAISTTGDPTGSYYRYAFQISTTKLNDYPHFGVWPDAYYMSINQFNEPAGTWGGAGAVAFERTAMLQGLPARMVYEDLFGVDPNLGGMLPSDLDGPAPPNGAPNLFLQADDDGFGYPQDQLEVWAFSVDWTTPANSTFTKIATLATAPFDSNLCGGSRNCIPQPGHPTQGLDAIADRLMYRVQYRNFGTFQSIVLNDTVDVDGADRAGVRWYELRKTTGAWSIRQQGTWSPDATDRWMGSAAMDGAGNIALGYSVSSSTVSPSIRFTGRLAGDPLGTMTQGEGSIVAGSGSQTNSAARWGDYSMLAVDPGDDCTFWYTNEYMQATSDHFWQTRIASFSLPGCGGTDSTPPAVSSFAPTTATTTNAATISYALSFSESVTGLAAGDFTRTGTAASCVVGAPSGSGASYTVAVTGCSEGTVVLTLNSGTVADLSSNTGPTTSATAATVTIDRTAPSLSLTALPSGSPTSASSFAVTATFGESVTGFTASDVTLGGTSNTATPWLVGTVSGSGMTYTFTVSRSNPANGTLTIAVASGKAADAAGNGNTASNTISYSVDASAPTATLTAPATPTNATTLAYQVGFSESVTGLAAGDFTRTGSATGCVVGAPTGSGAAYTVQLSGCSAGTVGLALNAGSVVDALSNAGPVAPVTAAAVTIDRTAPTVGTPKTSLRAGVTVSGSSMPMTTTWTAADAGGAGLNTYDVAQSTDGAAFVTVRTGLLSPSVSFSITSGHTYRFEVRAHDAAGNIGGWLAGPTLKPSLVQQTSASIVYHGTWTTVSSTVYSGGSARYASAAGAYASYTFSGRSIGVVASKGPSRGAVKVYLDGVLVSTVDCFAATAIDRSVIFSRTFSAVGTHTIKLVVVGTAGRPRVVLDAFEVIR